MKISGWIFLISFWSILLTVTFISYRILLSEDHIPVGPLEDEYHPLSCDLDERPDPSVSGETQE